MSEQPLLPPPEPSPAVAAETVTPHEHHIRLLSGLCGLGFLILVAAIIYVWLNPQSSAPDPQLEATLQTMGHRLDDLDGRLSQLERRPTPDMGKLNDRLDAMESKIVDETKIASRLDELSGRIQALSGRDQTGIVSAQQQIEALKARVASLEANAQGVESVANRTDRIAKLQKAALALAAGQPLGTIPDAPSALARYAQNAPPTEASLRLQFHQAEQSALEATQPADNSEPFADRVWQRAQNLITIRRGNDVVVGDASAIKLSRAQSALDAGDLGEAVRTVETLKGPPLQAMADWLSSAKGLLAARSALTEMATKT